jgi:tight adherence protein C
MLIAAMLMFGLSLFLVGELATAPNRRRNAALKRAAGYGAAQRSAHSDEAPQFRERVVAPAITRLAAVALRLNPKVSLEALGVRLRAAGFGGKIGPSAFLALKVALGLSGVLWGLALSVLATPTVGLLTGAFFACIGFIAPETILSSKVRARRERIRSELPDALDLLAVSVEAGLGLDGAISKLTEHMDGALVDEFAMTLGEMRIGESRHDALRRMSDRVPAPELGAFVRSVIQADQLGISLGRILRVQAADSRLRRQAAAEEKAMKAPIKMLFPTALFIFPAMFIVILGPAMLNLAHSLSFK